MMASRSDMVATALRIAALGSVAAIVVLSLVPGTVRPHTPLAGRYEHLLVYCASACLVRLGFRVPLLLGAASFFALAVALEVAQIWVPGRVAGVTDAVAGGLGGLAGLVAARVLQRTVRILSP